MSIFRYSTTLVVVHWEGVQCTVFSVQCTVYSVQCWSLLVGPHQGQAIDFDSSRLHVSLAIDRFMNALIM